MAESVSQKANVFWENIGSYQVQRAVKAAARNAGLAKRVTSHTFRHSFATHPLTDSYDIQGRSHDHDLHARFEPWRARRSQPRRHSDASSQGAIG